MGALVNAGFIAKLQQNLGLALVATERHKSLQKLRPVYSLV